MQKISGLIGKEAITLMDASCRGTVLNVYFNADLSKCKYFSLMLDDSEEIEWVAYKDLYSVKNDAIVIKSKSCIKKAYTGEVYPNPINLSAFNQDGVLLGVIKDVEIEGDKTENIITDLRTININSLLSFSEQLLVFNDSDKPFKVKRSAKKTSGSIKKADKAKPVIKENADKESPLDFGFYRDAVKIITKNAEPIKSPVKEQEKPSENSVKIKPIQPDSLKKNWLNDRPIETPLKIPPEQTAVYRSPMEENLLSRYGFLIGKRVQRPIFDQNGKVLAQENDLVNEDIIRKIKENGKLIMLALHSL